MKAAPLPASVITCPMGCGLWLRRARRQGLTPYKGTICDRCKAALREEHTGGR